MPNTFNRFSVLIEQSPSTFPFPVDPDSIIASVILTGVHSVSVLHSLLKKTFISGSIWPEIHSLPVKRVVVPFTIIGLSIFVDYCSFVMELIIQKMPTVFELIEDCVPSVTSFPTVQEISIELSLSFENFFALSMRNVLLPLPCNGVALMHINQNAQPRGLPLQNFAFIVDSIGTNVSAFSIGLSIFEESMIQGSINKMQLALAIREVILPLPVVNGSILIDLNRRLLDSPRISLLLAFFESPELLLNLFHRFRREDGHVRSHECGWSLECHML